MPLKISDSLDVGAPSLFELEKELRNINKAPRRTTISPAISSMAKDSRYNAEFDTFYKKANALREVSKKHSWTRATVASVARAVVGSGFKFVSHPIYGRNSKIVQEEMDKILQPVYDFFYGVKDTTKYIQDIIPLASKMYYMAVSLTYYGQAAAEIIYDSQTGQPIGFDVLPGIVRPNVNEYGRFMRPAYYFRPWNSQTVVAYRNPQDILYIAWPGTDFNIYGSSEYESVSDITIPSDLYASAAYRNHFENVGAPYNGFWVVSKDTSPEDYKQFLMTLINRYSGVVNFGRTPIVIKGDAEFRETRSRSNDDAPYLQGRQYNQEEISAISAVPSAKLGLAANTTKTNYREMRRDFHENTLRPIFELIEQAIYQQIMVRGFGMKDWMLSFNSPDLTTAIEQATIISRYIRDGVLNVNEGREQLGYPPREDAYGEVYYHPSNSAEVTSDGTNRPGDLGVSERAESQRQPEGGSMRQTNTARMPNESQPRIENSIDSNDLIDELKTWRTFATRIAEGKRTNRTFIANYIPKNIALSIQNSLDAIGEEPEKVKEFFADIIASLHKS